MAYLRLKLRKWLGINELQDAYEKGYDNGFEDDKIVKEVDMLERKAINMFCEQGYPNPLHVFDISPTGLPYIAQEPITKQRAVQLKQEAGLLKSMLLYDVIQETIRQEAVTKALKSDKWEDVITAKTMLVNLGIIKKIVDTIQGLDSSRIPEGSGNISQNMV